VSASRMGGQPNDSLAEQSQAFAGQIIEPGMHRL
jgi:hypothetical protein